GYIIEAVTEKADGVLHGFVLPFATPEKEEELKRRRKMILEKLMEKNSEFATVREYYELVRNNYNSRAWIEESSRCVGCGACTNVCPTCYCFGLADHKLKEKYARTMNWDSCQFSGFSRMAGMLNPREFHRQHFEHRYDHKFHHFKERYGFYACTGCGRCIEVCLGKIDMRNVLRRVEQLLCEKG
ncbi:MAG: 4Fe-4S dicluster domain-containing protein, partial [bacterium]